MIINNKHYRSVWMKNKTIYVIDQRLLPEKLKILKLKNYKQVAQAIKNMTVRGAPAIGAVAAYGLAISKEKKAKTILAKTRPTAYDLFHALNYVDNEKNKLRAAKEYVENTVNACKKIGEYGKKLIKKNAKIMTHCNAGALSTVDYGTALSPIRASKKQNPFVFVSETRPRLQGTLTAFELKQEKIKHALIADVASGFYMKETDLVIVGADRITKKDVANKIGTYNKAVLAKENKVKFYVAAPLSTFSKGDIPIEHRNEDEVKFIKGKKITSSKCLNPAFDITPRKYITGIITEKGIQR